MLRSLNTYTTYNAEDNKLKIPAFEVLTHLQDPSDLKKNSSSSSAISNLTSSETISRVTVDPDSDYEIWISDFTIEHEIRKRISLLVLMINFISQNLKISPTTTPLGTNHTNKQVCYNVHCTVIKTLKKDRFANKPCIHCWKRTDLPFKIKSLKIPWKGRRVVLKPDKQYEAHELRGWESRSYQIQS